MTLGALRLGMRLLLPLSLLLLAACAEVVIPKTPEAQQCALQCVMSYESCSAIVNGVWCLSARHDCLIKCPGAYEQATEVAPMKRGGPSSP
jgi:hypothetical protein